MIALLVGGPMNGEWLAVAINERRIDYAVPILASASPWVAAPSDADADAPVAATTFQRGTYEFLSASHNGDYAIYIWGEDLAMYRDLGRRHGAPQPVPDGAWHWCRHCDVKWWGDPECWNCHRVVTPLDYPTLKRMM